MTEASNTDQYDAWNGESGIRWVGSADQRDAVLSPVADHLLATAAIAPGERVLDIGCGCGATTIAAAHATGTSGSVVGLDLSAPMLDVARSRATTGGLNNVSFIQGDAQTTRLDDEFDVVISRFGTMFFDDPTAAFTNLASHLRPGGRLYLVTWQPLEANEWLVVPGATLIEYGSLPPAAESSAPGMFAQSEPDTIASVLSDAGLEQIASEPLVVPLTFGNTTDEAVDYLADSGPGRAILDTIPDNQRASALDQVKHVLENHADDHGHITLRAALWITTARR